MYQDPLGLPIFSYKLLRNFKVVEELDRETGNHKAQGKVSDKKKNRDLWVLEGVCDAPWELVKESGFKLDCPG